MKRNQIAGRELARRRVDAGLSPEQLGGLVGVSGHTVRRIEGVGSIPTPRVQFVIASYFGLAPSQLWPIGGRAALVGQPIRMEVAS